MTIHYCIAIWNSVESNSSVWSCVDVDGRKAMLKIIIVFCVLVTWLAVLVVFVDVLCFCPYQPIAVSFLDFRFVLFVT